MSLRQQVWSAVRAWPVLSDGVDQLRRRLRRGRPVPGLGVPAGRRAPAATATAPVVLLLALGLSTTQLQGWSRVVARAQADGVSLRPVWLLDSGDFPVLLPHGWAFDHVPRRADYDRVGAPMTYEEHLAARLELWRSRTGHPPVVPLLGGPGVGERAGTGWADEQADTERAAVMRLRAALVAAGLSGAGLSAPARAAGAGSRRTRS